MKRRVLSLLLVFALVSAALPSTVTADSTGVCFCATNDTLLELGSAAVYSGGGVYVPSRLFSTFGVYYNYFSSNATGMLYNNSKQIFFDANAGNCYDANGNYYSASAILHNGQIYVPVAWTSRYFGLSYSYISGVGYGDIVRVKNGSEVLTDSQFLDAASSLMRSRYNESIGGTVTTPTPTPPPAPSSSPEPEEDEKSGTVTLCFVGMPAYGVLDQLGKYGYRACFFLTEAEVKEAPDTVRRIYCAGSDLGVYCKGSPESEFPATASAIFAAAQVMPTLISSPSSAAKSCAEYAKAHACAYYAPRNVYASSGVSASSLLSTLEKASGRTTLTFVCDNGTGKLMSSLLLSFSTKKYTVLPLLETGL
ncbi:MAG: hypothetical protein ACOX66_02340 [Oscillospiraceae bacterium]|jgi:hypothetical protein